MSSITIQSRNPLWWHLKRAVRQWGDEKRLGKAVSAAAGEAMVMVPTAMIDNSNKQVKLYKDALSQAVLYLDEAYRFADKIRRDNTNPEVNPNPVVVHLATILEALAKIGITKPPIERVKKGAAQ